MKSMKLFLVTFVGYFIPISMLFFTSFAGIGCPSSSRYFECKVIYPSLILGGVIGLITMGKIIKGYKATGNLFSRSLIFLLLPIIIPALLIILNATLTPLQKLHLRGITLEKCQIHSCYVDVCDVMSRDPMSRELSLYKKTCDNAEFWNSLNNNY